ncbi:hypothetical protein IAE29_23355 [Ochrobactrum sp. S46]|nr:hypothetical protein [Ochrobactrum sp. S45]MBK0046260.1 hypothetical protein [Ochrobactrum sp. S46]
MSHSPSTEFAFEAWATPFEDAAIDLIGVEFSGNGELSFRVRVLETGAIYRVNFEYVSAFRVLDEHGLLDIWEKTARLGGRPGNTTFRVRNHAWTEESPVSFAASDGWSYIAASDGYCIEVVATVPPTLAAEILNTPLVVPNLSSTRSATNLNSRKPEPDAE